MFSILAPMEQEGRPQPSICSQSANRAAWLSLSCREACYSAAEALLALLEESRNLHMADRDRFTQITAPRLEFVDKLSSQLAILSPGFGKLRHKAFQPARCTSEEADEAGTYRDDPRRIDIGHNP